MNPELLANRFKEFRENAGYTQKELAKLIGKSHVTVQSYEKGTSFPNADTLLKMCDVYDTDPNDLLGWYIDHPRERPRPSDPDRAELLRCYDQCTPERQGALMQQALDGAFMSRERSERDLPDAREA